MKLGSAVSILTLASTAMISSARAADLSNCDFQFNTSNKKGQFVNNPANSRKKLKLIFPNYLTDKITDVSLYSPDGELLESGLKRSTPNEYGNRSRFYGKQSPSSYPEDMLVVVTSQEGTICAVLPKPSQRYDWNGSKKAVTGGQPQPPKPPTPPTEPPLPPVTPPQPPTDGIGCDIKFEGRTAKGFVWNPSTQKGRAKIVYPSKFNNRIEKVQVIIDGEVTEEPNRYHAQEEGNRHRFYVSKFGKDYPPGILIRMLSGGKSHCTTISDPSKKYRP
jgi:hypothetical protein